MSEVDDSRPQWPAWYGFAALGIALVATLLGGGIIVGVIAAVAGVDSDSTGLTLALTVVQDAPLLGSAVSPAARSPHRQLRSSDCVRSRSCAAPSGRQSRS